MSFDTTHTTRNSITDKGMAMATTTVNGMAASIRAAIDNETFDLAGHDVSPLFEFDAIRFCALQSPLSIIIRLPTSVPQSKMRS